MPTRAIMTKGSATTVLMIAALAVFAFQTAGAQSNNTNASTSAKTKTAGTADASTGSNTSDVATTLKAVAEAVGLARWSGVGGERLPEVDVISTMEFWGSGTTYGLGQPYKAGEPWLAFKTEYHAALGYNPPAMRVEMTRTSSDGGAPQHSIQVVRENYAWNESEIGAGLMPGKGVATPDIAAAHARFLHLWVLPYGVIKAALAAGGKTRISTENGATVITCPLEGPLANVTAKVTLDAKNLVMKVETRTDNPALGDMATETDYSDYAERGGDTPTNVLFPGRIVQKQGGHPVLDIQVTKVDANNPYLVFPVPSNVKTAVQASSTITARSSNTR